MLSIEKIDGDGVNLLSTQHVSGVCYVMMDTCVFRVREHMSFVGGIENGKHEY